MTILRQAAEEYLRLRRALGFKLRDVGPALMRFLAFCENEGAAVVTVDLARRWAMSTNVSPARTTWRFQIVRDFAIHHQASDPRTEIPPKGLFQDYYDRRNPYLYSKEEIGRLLQAARELPPGQGLRHQTYSTLFSLLVATGLRVGEALALDAADVDWQAGLLVVRQSKFRKSRLVPVHSSTLDRLRQYQEKRARIYPTPKTSAFFVSETGQRLPYRTVNGLFRRLCARLRLQGSSTSRKPRIHDFRHRFVVNTLIRWYREGVDVERFLPRLSTYLGHGCCAHTYWYLTAVPELLQLATERLEQKGQSHAR
jgi:integrase/recombinase XerD